MINSKKFLTTMFTLIGVLIISLVAINLLMSNLMNLLSTIVNIIIVAFIITVLFSVIITNNVLKDKKVSKNLMKLNLNIFKFLYPVIVAVSQTINISKNEIRKVTVKLNNTYICSNQYNLNPEDIMILLPHCIQKSSCKLKVTNDIENCSKCGLCSIKDLADLKESLNVNVFVATGGTLARKIIKSTRPKAVIAVACERDLTAGIQDISKIPVIGVFNKRPNGPCIDTTIDIEEVKEAVKFLLGK